MLLATAPVAARAQEPSLREVLARAADYVATFRGQLSGIVSEERYEQKARTPAGTDQWGFPLFNDARVVLRSDFLLVRAFGADRPIEFRDVFEVNGEATRDRADRLTELFVNPTRSARGRIQNITNESARRNIGAIERTLNTPTLALQFLDARYQGRFRFARVEDVEPALQFDLTLPGDAATVWVIEYEEVQANTLIHGKDMRDLPVRGRFWVESTDGRVLASELLAEDEDVGATIDVRYAVEPAIGQVVPVEMRELYTDRYGSHIEGVATYGNFRRFQVETTDKVIPLDDRTPGR
jgi:hypothetical protein